MNPSRTHLLGELLKGVSRSFYLTLRVLPEGVRDPIGLGYLLARAADTIADTDLLPPDERLGLLLLFREQVIGTPDSAVTRRIAQDLVCHQRDSKERELLQSLFPALSLLQQLEDGDRAEVKRVVTTLTTGMEFDLRTFPVEGSGALAALETREELERYTYLVAGCVGEFWTRLTRAHTPALFGWDESELSTLGVRFGKALQYTNVLRDCAKDLRIGRCYLPPELLSPLGLRPDDLLRQDPRARPVLLNLLRTALGHYDAARQYILAIPERQGRLRLACLWPVLIGLATLRKLAENPAWLDPEKPSKVSRATVRKMLLFSLPCVGCDTLVDGWIRRLAAEVEACLATR